MAGSGGWSGRVAPGAEQGPEWRSRFGSWTVLRSWSPAFRYAGAYGARLRCLLWGEPGRAAAEVLVSQTVGSCPDAKRIAAIPCPCSLVWAGSARRLMAGSGVQGGGSRNPRSPSRDMGRLPTKSGTGVRFPFWFMDST